MTQLQPAKPDPALKRLERLVGTWDMKGLTLDAKEDNITGWITFAWLPGGFFLQGTGEINFKGDKVQSVEIIGYNPAAKNFPAQVYSNLSGDVLTYHWNVQGDTVTHWEDSSIYTGTFSQYGKTLSGGWRPKEGKPRTAENTYDAEMVRR